MTDKISAFDSNHLIVPIWSLCSFYFLNAPGGLLLASGYLKVVDYEEYDPIDPSEPKYELELTNLEVLRNESGNTVLHLRGRKY